MTGRVAPGRLARCALALYPRGWRDRYGDEVIDLCQSLVEAGRATPARAGLDLLAGAGIERVRALARSRRAIATSSAVIGVFTAAVVLDTNADRRDGGVMAPYFDSHPVGVALLAVVVLWLFTELLHALQIRATRRDSGPGPARPVTAATRARRRLVVAGWVLVANAALYLAPVLVPAAAIRPGVGAFAAGIALMVAGVALRVCSFNALGSHFGSGTAVSVDQPVITGGPYRLVRHPAYAGTLLIIAGIGAASANWIGLAALSLPAVFLTLRRIRVEEANLLAVLDEPYRRYAAEHKRLVPAVW